MNDKKFEVGDILYVSPVGNAARRYGEEIRKATVQKVGRKLIYIQIDGIYGEYNFEKKSTSIVDYFTGERIWFVFSSMQEIEDKEEGEQLVSQLKHLFSLGGKGYKLTLEQLRAIRDIVGEDLLN